MSQPNLLTIFIYRRFYGRRYTELPVDQIDREGFTIDCSAGLIRPEIFDLRPDDIVRWRQGDRYVEALIAAVRRSGPILSVQLRDAHPLAEDFFPY